MSRAQDDVPKQAAVDLPSSRHPFELFTMALCAFVGLPLLAGDARPGSINELLPDWAADIWGGMLVLGAITALVGIFWRNRVTGIVLEQVGLMAVGLGTLFYGVGVGLSVGQDGIYAMIFVFGFGTSCIWRYFQLARFLRTLRHVVSTDG